MRILLVTPARSRGRGYALIPNLGLGYLASALDRRRHHVEIVDLARERKPPEAIAELVRSGGFDLVGVSTFSCSWGAAQRCLRVAREARPAVITALGGPHPTFEPGECLRALPDLDFVFRGESEVGFPRFVDLCEDGRRPSPAELASVAGLGFRENGEVRLNEPGLLPSLDANPIPAWELLHPHLYPLAPNGIFSRRPRIAPIVATRGCPYPCSFCGAGQILGKRQRQRAPETIIDELRLLVERYGIGEFHVMDDLFTLRRSFVIAVCDAIERSGLDVVWALPNGVRLDTLDADLVRRMERAGCYSMAIGIESGSDRVLADMRKDLTVDLAREKVALVKSASSIRLTGFFVVGYPTEDESDIESTIRLSLELPLDKANFFNFSPFPGSPLYYQLKSEGKLAELCYDDLYIHHLAFDHPRIPARRLRALIRKAHLKFYLRPGVLWRLLGEIQSPSQLAIIARRAFAILGRA